MLKAVKGVIHTCSYCGEGVNSKVKYCATCTTQPKRKLVFEANAAIIKENKAKGFTVPETLKDWH